MTEHVTEWLSAYSDKELRGIRLHQVEKHLAECQICRAELETLQNLSALLHEVPALEFPPTERFTAQVNLRLPRELPLSTKQKVQEAGWWMIPVSLLMIWIFISASALFQDVVSTANELGLLKDVPAWAAINGSSTAAFWSSRLGEFGLLNGSSLKWIEATEALTRNIILQVSIGFLYLSWFAIWWARHTRQGHGRSLEG